MGRRTMMRWKVFLGCGHDLASDDIPDFETAELCPEHGTYVRITGCVAFRDDDIQVTSEELASTVVDPSPLDFDFIDDATGEGRR